MTLSKSFKVPRSLDEWVGEEENQGNHQAINRQGLHECQGQQQHTSQVICHLRLARDAINASARSNALANTRTNCSQANGEASANGGQSRDPHGALISKCCLWCHQGGRGQSCCGSSACNRSRHMGAARSRHEGGQECTAAQQHGTSQDEGASHSGQRLTKLAIYWRGCYCISVLWARVRDLYLTCWTVNSCSQLHESEVWEWHVKSILACIHSLYSCATWPPLARFPSPLVTTSILPNPVLVHVNVPEAACRLWAELQELLKLLTGRIRPQASFGLASGKCHHHEPLEAAFDLLNFMWSYTAGCGEPKTQHFDGS